MIRYKRRKRLTRLFALAILCRELTRKPSIMGKASELDDYLWQRAASMTPEEQAKIWPKPPELRLRIDTPSVEIQSDTLAQDIVNRLKIERVGCVALNDLDGMVTAVTVPVERYLELVGAELARSPYKEAYPDGRIAPTEDSLAALSVEQVDPQATWVDVEGRRPV